MTINNTFTVLARCKKYETGVIEPDLHSEIVDIDLTFNLESAEKFLFRFYSSKVLVDNYTLVYDIEGVVPNISIKGISLFDKRYTYIVRNASQLISEVINGYRSLIILDKFSTVSQFDFNNIIDIINSSNIEDEFNEE